MADTQDMDVLRHLHEGGYDLLISPELLESSEITSLDEDASEDDATGPQGALMPGLWAREFYHQLFCYCGPLLSSDITYRNVCNAYQDLASVWAELDRK